MEEYDLLVIGGGINGTAIALDAAGRGLSVLLCERDDLASGTSSASSKLIHGGLRYLKNMELRMVKSALQEREVLLNKAPHLIQPMEFVFPIKPKIASSWLHRLGFMLYDHLGKRKKIPHSQRIKLAQDVHGVICKGYFKEAYIYYDCSVDDARLVVTNALAAQEKGATILTHTCVTALDYKKPYWHVSLQSREKSLPSTVLAKCVVNAAGPWVNQIQAMMDDELAAVRFIAGSHIVVPRLYKEDHAFVLPADNERVVFVMPFAEDYSLIGTTEVESSKEPKMIHITPEEKDYLCGVVNQHFKTKLTQQDIVWRFTGVRTLVDTKEKNATQLSRDYLLHFNPHKPLLTVIGGKITVHRLLAEAAMQELQAVFPQLKPAWTNDALLPGAHFEQHDFTLFLHDLFRHYFWLPQSLVRRLAHQYGDRVYVFLEGAEEMADLGQHFGHGLYQKEVDYLCEHEWAEDLDDIIWRRTKLGLKMTTIEKMQLQQYLANKHKCGK